MTDSYIPRDIYHTPAFIDWCYNPECLLKEHEAIYMIELHNSNLKK